MRGTKRKCGCIDRPGEPWDRKDGTSDMCEEHQREWSEIHARWQVEREEIGNEEDAA